MVGTITLALSLDNVYYLGEVKYKLNYIPQNIWIENLMLYIFYQNKKCFTKTKTFENCWKRTNGQVIKIKTCPGQCGSAG